MAPLNDVVRAVTAIISSISRSIISGSNGYSTPSEDDDRHRGVVFLVSGIRDRLRIITPGRPNREPSAKEVERYVNEVRASIRILRSNRDFMEVSSAAPVKLEFYGRPDERNILLEEHIGRVITSAEALELIEGFIKEATIEPSEPENNNESKDIASLSRIVPAQKIAPVQLEFQGNKLVLSRKANQFASADTGNIEAARAALISSGENIIKELSNSNVDRRLLENIAAINNNLLNNDNVIQLGINNIACGMVCNALHDVISDTLSATVKSYVLGVDMYVSQFPDWGRFVEQAATVRIDEDDIVSLKAATARIVGELEARPEIVDSEVPKAFSKLKELLDDPARTSKKAAFAVLRSIGNLVSKVLSFSTSLIEKTTNKVIDGLSTAAAGVILFGLLTLAVNSAQGVSAIAGKVTEMSWMRTAIEIVQSHIDKIKK